VLAVEPDAHLTHKGTQVLILGDTEFNDIRVGERLHLILPSRWLFRPEKQAKIHMRSQILAIMYLPNTMPVIPAAP
jgi:hypothetical protein